MAGIEHRGDTSRAQRRVPTRVATGDDGDCTRIARVPQERVHGVRHGGLPLGSLYLRHASKVGPIGVVELHWKLVGTYLSKRGRKVIDRVILDGPRAVSAWVGHFKSVVLIGLLAGLDVVGDSATARIEFSRGAFVEREGGVDEVATILCEPLSAVERSS